MMEKDPEQEKIAALLRKQGVAASSMAAEQMAQEILRKKDLGQKYNELEKKRGMEKMAAESGQSRGLSEEQIVAVLQKFTDMFTKEIEKITERLNSLEKQLDKFQSSGSTGISPAVMQTASAEPAQEREEGQQTLIQSASSGAVVQPVVQASGSRRGEPEKVNPHPRSAPFDNQKYSVEKFFYSGGGKR